MDTGETILGKAIWYSPLILDNLVYRRCKDAYYKASLKGEEKFVFQEQELMTKFAQYLLEYVDMERERRHLKTFNAATRKWKYSMKKVV